jgi:hypothetical protein
MLFLATNFGLKLTIGLNVLTLVNFFVYFLVISNALLIGLFGPDDMNDIQTEDRFAF